MATDVPSWMVDVVVGGQGQELERVVLGLLDQDRPEADRLGHGGQPGHLADVERGVGLPQPGVELAEREQGFDDHATSLTAMGDGREVRALPHPHRDRRDQS